MNRHRGARPLLALLIGWLAVVAAGQPAAAAPPSGGVPPGQARYIVVLDDAVSDPDAVADRHARDHGAQVRAVYRSALRGYAAVIPNDRVAAVRADRRVNHVEPDQTVEAAAQVVPYGVTKVGADVSPTARAGDGTGAVDNVSVYVIDSGIYKRHQDLRVTRHVNFTAGVNRDCHGHGTHVAGIAAAKDNSVDVVGVSPGSPLTAVKVLDCDGKGLYSDVIAGIDWVTANASRPAVANMSLGGPPSPALDKAVGNSAASGILYTLAAGNAAKDACEVSPARTGGGVDNGIVTVAATDAGDLEAPFSNFGSCVDIWAPGVSVLSTKKGGGTTTLSGTSMAAPHVAGGASVYLSQRPSEPPSSVEAALKSLMEVPGSGSKDGRLIGREHIAAF